MNQTAATKITSSQTLDPNYSAYLVDATAGSVTCTLPSATNSDGLRFLVARFDAVGANTLTITTTNSQAIDGAASATLAPSQSMEVVALSGNWSSASKPNTGATGLVGIIGTTGPSGKVGSSSVTAEVFGSGIVTSSNNNKSLGVTTATGNDPGVAGGAGPIFFVANCSCTLKNLRYNCYFSSPGTSGTTSTIAATLYTATSGAASFSATSLTVSQLFTSAGSATLFQGSDSTHSVTLSIADRWAIQLAVTKGSADNGQIAITVAVDVI
jgi:hypothetical protein